MMVGSRTHTLLFPLLLLASLMVVSEGTWDLKYRHVYIKNGLDNHTILRFRCKSADDDLGTQNLKYDEEFKFQFRPSIFTNTVFHCSFTWDGKYRTFPIYDFKRDENSCHDCYWSIKQNFPCRFDNKTQGYDFCAFDYGFN
ncbi:unnamed protein product [Lupinus luteus]|uniref:S-protein homolog n=1 Tax=Lupinus luteus TaxID=3873 RepID=A0AAV1WPT5_LUPLU